MAIRYAVKVQPRAERDIDQIISGFLNVRY